MLAINLMHVSPVLRRCRACCADLPVASFYVEKRRDAPRSLCKGCHVAQSVARSRGESVPSRLARSPASNIPTTCKQCGESFARQHIRKQRLCGPCELRDGRDRYYADHGTTLARARTYPYRRKYGHHHQHFADMLVAQGMRCIVCQCELRSVGGRSKDESTDGIGVVDHCHRTGDVRGIACFKCNAAFGFMGDDPARLRAAADYLERARTERD